jgi:hypothetical protein
MAVKGFGGSDGQRERGTRTARVYFNGIAYDFQLTREIIDLPDGRRIDYWSLSGAGLRERGGGRNGLAVVESWWAAMYAASAAGPDELDLEHYLLARAHLALAHGHASLRVYDVPHLGPRTCREYSVDVDEIAELRAGMVETVGSGGGGGGGGEDDGHTFVQRELERLFLRREGRQDGGTQRDELLPHDPFGGLPVRGEAGVYHKALALWLHYGKELAYRYGRIGVERWLDVVTAELRKYQGRSAAKLKRGTGGRVRRFASMFALECASRFHVCLANAWVELIPWLRAHEGLDPLSERFMWQMHAVTVGVGGGGDRGPLCGYPLALHPAGRFLLGRPEYLEKVVRWLEDPAFEAACEGGAAAASPTYQECCTAFLCAAREYDRCRRYDEGEGRPQRNERAVAAGRREPGLAPDGQGRGAGAGRDRHEAADEVLDRDTHERVREIFDELAGEADVRCQGGCGRRPVFDRLARASATEAEATFSCGPCGRSTVARFAKSVVAAVMSDPQRQLHRDGPDGRVDARDARDAA